MASISGLNCVRLAGEIGFGVQLQGLAHVSSLLQLENELRHASPHAGGFSGLWHQSGAKTATPCLRTALAGPVSIFMVVVLPQSR